MDHAQDADDVGVEQRLRLADARFLDGADQIDTGIVDQHVDAASAAEHLFNAGLDRSLIADIERHELNARERTCRCGSADAAEDPVAAAGQQLGGGPANAGRCTRDQDNAARSVRHVNSCDQTKLAASLKLHRAKDVQDHLLALPSHVAEDEAMPYSPEHKRDTREKILESARRLFNRKGYSGVSIEEIMSDAGLTHGGFYRHFSGKDELYAAAVRQFLCKKTPAAWQKRREPSAVTKPRAQRIVDAYFSREHFDDRNGCCPLIGMASDVERGGKAVKAAYQEVVEQMVKVFEDHLNEPAGARACAGARRSVRRRHGVGEERGRSGLGRRLPSRRARRSAEDRGLELNLQAGDGPAQAVRTA